MTPSHTQLWHPREVVGTLKQLGHCALLAAAITAPVLGVGGYTIYRSAAVKAEAGARFTLAGQAWEQLTEGPAGPVLPADAALHGRELFRSACAACHGSDGRGGLGKDLTRSDFVAGLDDAALHAFIQTGRPEAKPLPMPPKGGRADLTGGDVADIAVYIRGLQDPRRLPALPEVAAAPAAPSESEKNAALAAAGGDADLAEFIASGTKLYNSTCIACHGANGAGIKNNGKTLAKSPFVAGLDDDALLAFIKKGRDPSDPANTTGVGMPAKGGNPALSDDDLLDIIAYLRTLQDKSAAVSK